jgi:hypothetical protein
MENIARPNIFLDFKMEITKQKLPSPHAARDIKGLNCSPFCRNSNLSLSLSLSLSLCLPPFFPNYYAY